MPTRKPPFDYDEFFQHVLQGHDAFFRWVEHDLGTEQQRDLFFTWFTLLKTDSIQRWLLGSKWAARVRASDAPTLEPVLRFLLRRHLLHLETRRDTSKLAEFWNWATASSLSSERATILGQQRFAELPTLAVNSSSAATSTVTEQEAAFVNWLETLQQACVDPALNVSLRWATETISQLILERRLPSDRPATRCQVGVVFAWRDISGRDLPPPELFRPGWVVRFQLLEEAGSEDCLQPAAMFDPDFRNAVEDGKHRIGVSTFRVLKHEWDWLPDGFLQDTSGSLAIWLAQFVAAGFDGIDHWTLPPYLVMTATLDPHGASVGGGAAPVGHIEAKLQTLVEEGIRVAYVADDKSDSPDKTPLGLPQGLGGLCASPDSVAISSSAEAVEPLGQAQGREIGGPGKNARPTAHPDLIRLPVPTAHNNSGNDADRSIVETLARDMRTKGWLTPVLFPVKPPPALPSDGAERRLAKMSKDVVDPTPSMPPVDDDPTVKWRRDFVPPAYILDRLSVALSSIPEKFGVLELIAPSMWGKSRLMYALRHGWCDASSIQDRGIGFQPVISSDSRNDRLEAYPTNWCVLSCLVTPGLWGDVGNILEDLSKQASRLPLADGRGTLDDEISALPLPHRERTLKEVRSELIRLLTLVRQNCCGPHQPLVLIVDGVDELLGRADLKDKQRPALLDVLPRPHELPPGCFLLLTRRSGELPQGVRESLDDVVDGRLPQDLQSQRAALNALPRERVHAVVELDPSTDSTAQETVIRRFVSQSLEPLWPGSFTPSPPTPRRWSSALLLPETAAEARPSDELLSESLGESVATRHGTTDTGSVGKDGAAASPALLADALINAIVERSAGGFLKASLIVETLRWEHDENPSAPLPQVESLPTEDRIFPWSLSALAAVVNRTQSDAHYFEHWHRRVLGLVTVACEPITRTHLRCWLSVGVSLPPLGLPQGLGGFCATGSQLDSSSAEAVEPLGQAQGRQAATPPTDGQWDILATERLHQTLIELASFLHIDRSQDDHDQRLIQPIHREFKAWLESLSATATGAAASADTATAAASAAGSLPPRPGNPGRGAGGEGPSTLAPAWSTLTRTSHTTIITAAEAQVWPEDDDFPALDREPTRYHLLHAFAHFRVVNESMVPSIEWIASHTYRRISLERWRFENGFHIQSIRNLNTHIMQLDECIGHYGGVAITLTRNPRLVGSLAKASSNRGASFTRLQKLSLAVDDHKRAISLTQQMVDGLYGCEANAIIQAPTVIAELYAYTTNLGEALLQQGDYAPAVECFESSASGAQHLLGATTVATDSDRAFRWRRLQELAICLMNHGTTLRRWMNTHDNPIYIANQAETKFETAAQSFRQLIQEKFQGIDGAVAEDWGIANQFAMCLSEHATHLKEQEKWDHALKGYNEAADLRWQLVMKSGGIGAAIKNKPALVKGLGMTLMNRGVVWLNQSRFDEAIADFSEAAKQWNDLVESKRGGMNEACKVDPQLVSSIALAKANTAETILARDGNMGCLEARRIAGEVLTLRLKVLENLGAQAIPAIWQQIKNFAEALIEKCDAMNSPPSN